MTGQHRQTLVSRGIWNSAIAAVSEHKMRAFLSTLGVVIGSASIVLVVSAGVTGSRYVVSQIEAVGANLAYAELTRTGGGTAG